MAEITGLDTLRRAIAALPDVLQTQVSERIMRAAQTHHETIRATAPVVTGTYRDRLEVTSPNPLRVLSRARAPHSWLLEHGHRAPNGRQIPGWDTFVREGIRIREAAFRDIEREILPTSIRQAGL